MIEPFRGDPLPSVPKSFIGNPHAFKYCGPLIETFRGDGLGVIEAFRGDEEVGIHMLLSLNNLDS